MESSLFDQLLQLKTRAIKIRDKTLEQEHQLNQSIGKENMKLNEILSNQSQIINLSIGGKRYSTSIATLTKQNSIFTPYMSSIAHNDTISIDHSPALFDYIIQFMRKGTLNIEEMTSQTKRDLFEEAKYYELSALADFLEAFLCKIPINDVTYPKDHIDHNFYPNLNDYSNPNHRNRVKTSYQIIFELSAATEINRITIYEFKNAQDNWDQSILNRNLIETCKVVTHWFPLENAIYHKEKYIHNIIFPKVMARFIRITPCVPVGISYFQVSFIKPLNP